jgi:hypothetical protein
MTGVVEAHGTYDMHMRKVCAEDGCFSHLLIFHENGINVKVVGHPSFFGARLSSRAARSCKQAASTFKDPSLVNGYTVFVSTSVGRYIKQPACCPSSRGG